MMDSWCELLPENAAVAHLIHFEDTALDILGVNYASSFLGWSFSKTKIVVRFSCKGKATEVLKAASTSDFIFKFLDGTEEVDNPGMIKDAYPGFNRYGVLALPVPFQDPSASDMWNQLTSFGFFIDDAIPVVTLKNGTGESFYVPDLISVMYKEPNPDSKLAELGRLVYIDIFQRKFIVLLPKRGSIVNIIYALHEDKAVLHVRPVELSFDALAAQSF